MKYKEYRLAKNSYAYYLYNEGELNKLDKHLKELEQKNKDLEKRYTKK
jgi:hypothetical protein